MRGRKSNEQKAKELKSLQLQQKQASHFFKLVTMKKPVPMTASVSETTRPVPMTASVSETTRPVTMTASVSETTRPVTMTASVSETTRGAQPPTRRPALKDITTSSNANRIIVTKSSPVKVSWYRFTCS